MDANDMAGTIRGGHDYGGHDVKAGILHHGHGEASRLFRLGNQLSSCVSQFHFMLRCWGSASEIE